jgi:hypothetical protein
VPSQKLQKSFPTSTRSAFPDSGLVNRERHHSKKGRNPSMFGLVCGHGSSKQQGCGLSLAISCGVHQMLYRSSPESSSIRVPRELESSCERSSAHGISLPAAAIWAAKLF